MEPADCPKTMTYGPCGGVTPAGGCEIEPLPCPFADRVVEYEATSPPRRPRPLDLGTALVDLVLPPNDDELAEVVDVLAAAPVTALVGEHLTDPPPHIPHRHAERLAALGLPAVVTLTGRWRTPDEHRREIERIADAGVVAVHCVTGDHPSVRPGPIDDTSFSLDGTRLAELARDTGVGVSVAESPAARPREQRPDRVLGKQRAGADVAVLNHADTVDALVDFADRCRSRGAEVDLVAPVPVVTDAQSARSLASFPGLVLPTGLVDTVLGALDPRAAGVAHAVDIGRRLLDSGRFAAVNLSGDDAGLSHVQRAEMMVDLVAALG